MCYFIVVFTMMRLETAFYIYHGAVGNRTS